MSKKKPKFIQWDKCVHIHACRRFAEIVERKTGKKISRGCDENCSAYQEFEGLDMACEWLKNNMDRYARSEYCYELDYSPDSWVDDCLIEDFREAMEDN